MANNPNLYRLWKKALMDNAGTDNNSGIVDTASNVRPHVVLITNTVYSFSQTHQFYNPVLTTGSPIVGGAAGDQQITPTATTVGGVDGVFGSSGVVTFTAISGASVDALIIYRSNAGANTTWRLMSYYDTVGGGLPVTPNGGNITVTWNASGIFQLSDANAKYDIERIGNYGPLGVYRYRYRVPHSERYIGLIAQEVERVLPHAVRRHGSVRYVNYGAVHEGLNQRS